MARYLFLRSRVFFHQIHRAVGEFKKVRVRPVAIGQDRKTQLAIAIAKKESRVAGEAAAVREISITITDL